MIGFDVVDPLYSISSYNSDIYRVVKYKGSFPRGCRDVCRKTSFSDEDVLKKEKFNSALARARTMAREYGLCNTWEYFVTLTLDKEKVDRYSLVPFLKEFLQWIQNLNKQGEKIRYIFVPEQHKDGAWHLHGLMSGIKESEQPLGTPESIVKSGFGCWREFSLRYGFSTVSPVVSNVGCGFYITKYITKSLGSLSEMFGVHTYYHSRGLSKSVRIGFRYSPSPYLDGMAKYSGKHCDTGFFKLIDTGFAVDFCEEVNPDFSGYILEDLNDGSVLAVANIEPALLWDVILGEQIDFNQLE